MIPCLQCGQLCKNQYGVHVHQSRKHPEVISNICNTCGDKLTKRNQRPSDRKNHDHICRKCHINLDKGYKNNDPERYGNYKGKYNFSKYLNDHNRKLKIEMIKAYGGKCSCCGEDNFEFLCIDHIYADGSIERNKSDNNLISGGSHLYRHLKKLGWPKDRYRLLCHNCNFSLAAYGYCPHQTQIELFCKPFRIPF